MKFYVKNRVITADSTNLIPITENADYMAEFETDEEWKEKAVTARFVAEDGTYTDVLLNEDMTCTIPAEALKGNRIMVGIYTDTMVSTSCLVPLRQSIKSGCGAPAAPVEDVYSQILANLNQLNQKMGGIEDGDY